MWSFSRKACLIPALLLGPVAWSPSARAFSSNFDASLGFSSLEIVAGKGFDQVMESLSTIDVHYNVIFSSINSAFGLGFQEMFDTNFGNLAFTHFDLGGRWYPFGMNGERKILDNDVEGKFWNAAPFLGASMGLGNVSIDAGTDGQFNAVMVDATVRLGLEVPVGANFIALGQLGYIFSVTSFANSTALTFVDYSGFQVFVGVRFTPF